MKTFDYSLGEIVVTNAARKAISAAGVERLDLHLSRHLFELRIAHDQGHPTLTTIQRMYIGPIIKIATAQDRSQTVVSLAQN